MKALKLITLFLGCRLAWIWVDQCGSDIGLGEALPFCIECSGFQTLLRLSALGVAVWRITLLLKSQPSVTQIHQALAYPGQQFRVHWHRIAYLFAILTYPIWVWWVDKNTAIPGPDRVPLFSLSCSYPGFKGTLLWVIVMVFAALGLRILNRG